MEVLGVITQSVGSFHGRRSRLGKTLFYGGLGVYLVFRTVNFLNEKAVADDSRRKDDKLAYQEAILRKVPSADLAKAELEVEAEEGKLKLLNGMRSEFAAMLKAEDASSGGGQKP